MKTILYLNGKQTTRKQITELIGKDRLDKHIKDATETYREDPLIENDFMVPGGILTIRFE